MQTYDPAVCVTFRKTKEQWGALSNMAPGFPIRLPDLTVPSSEALYQACRFPAHPQVQTPILIEKNAMASKMLSKPHRHLTRPDWEEPAPGVRVEIMRWALRAKLLFHPTTFGDLLMSTGKVPIVEDSHRDRFWGAVRGPDGSLVGENMLGQLLMALREEVRERGIPTFVSPPVVPDFLLLGQPVPTLTR
jgi:ribA/ribD-fused uncharacterized protein